MNVSKSKRIDGNNKASTLTALALLIGITINPAFISTAQADDTTAVSVQYSNPSSASSNLASQYVATLPPTSDPIENEARDFFVFLGEEKPEFVAEFIKVYQPPLERRFKGEALAKRYVVLGATDFIVDEDTYFSVALVTDEQINELNKTLGARSDQDKYDLYGKYIDKTSDSSVWEKSKRLDEEIAKLDEEIAKLDEENKKLDEENKKLDEEIAQLDETIYLLDKLNQEANK